MLGALLGGLAGLLFPPAAAAAGGAAATGIGALLGKAMLPALGAGLGTLATGGDGKDAIRNALLMGAGTTLFPGMGKGLQESKFGRSITGGIADILGMGAESDPNVPPLLRVAQSVMSPSGAGGTPAPAAAPITPETAYNMVRPVVEPEMPYNMVRPGEPQRTSVPTIGDIGMARPGYFEPPYSLSQRDEMARPGYFEPPSSLAQMDEFVRPEGEIPYVPGMDMSDDISRDYFQRFLQEDEQPRSSDLAMDYLLSKGAMGRSLRGGSMPRELLLPRGFAQGGAINGPGTGTSDSIPAQIYQDGKPVRKAALSDGEFVMTADAVKGAGNGNRNRGMTRMYELMRRFESGEMA